MYENSLKRSCGRMDGVSGKRRGDSWGEWMKVNAISKKQQFRGEGVWTGSPLEETEASGKQNLGRTRTLRGQGSQRSWIPVRGCAGPQASRRCLAETHPAHEWLERAAKSSFCLRHHYKVKSKGPPYILSSKSRRILGVKWSAVNNSKGRSWLSQASSRQT